MTIFEAIADALDIHHPIWGHSVAGSPLCFFGAYILWRCLQNAQSLAGDGRTFAEAFIPDADLVHLSKLSKVVTYCSGFLIVALLVVEQSLAHASMFFPFLAVGYTGLLESQRRLPLDSHRIIYALVCLCQCLGMYDHAMMKTLKSDEKMHIASSLSFLSTAVLMAYSVKFPSSTVAYIMGWASVILQGLWLVIDGLILKFVTNERLSPHLVYTYFVLTVMALAMAVAIPAAHLVPYEVMIGNDKPRFRRLMSHDEDDDDEEAAVLPPGAKVI